jgi:hypothetical protein
VILSERQAGVSIGADAGWGCRRARTLRITSALAMPALIASLKQRQPVNRKDGKPSFSDQTSMLGLPKTANMGLSERALIDHGLKWWPTKKYQANLTDNGTSPEWRLEVTSLTRAESTFPADGIPFSVVLTIEDPDGQKPLFQTFRRYLQSRNVQVDDIRLAQRLRARP